MKRFVVLAVFLIGTLGLSACQEFDIACGYPANADDIERRVGGLLLGTV